MKSLSTFKTGRILKALSNMSIDKLLPLQMVIDSIIMGNAASRVYSMLEVLPIEIMCVPQETQSFSLLSLLVEKDTNEDKLLEIMARAFLARDQISEVDFSFLSADRPYLLPIKRKNTA